ncbi:MAG: hypothetical protein ACRD3F_11970 [Acidobacteriaceae bacterium]
MSNPAPICTHIKTEGIRCGSPAVSGTDFCHHHSAVKMALGKAPSRKGQRGGFEPIPFVFPEDRASMQINFFLLLQAFNEGRVDLRNYRAMLGMLKAMAANLGKTGSLVEQASDQRSVVSGQERGNRQEATGNGERDKGAGGEKPFEFSPEMFAKFEEIERLDPNDPSYADRIRAAVAEGLGELKAQGLDLMSFGG